MVPINGEISYTAAAFHEARVSRGALTRFPGPVPISRDHSYAIQRAQIMLRGETVAGWKVAMVAPSLREAFGADRLTGPIFASRRINYQPDAQADWHVIHGGFAAIEAEFIAVIAKDAPVLRRMPSLEEAASLIGSWHAGMELAGSPLQTINDLGPMAVVADCGNNDGAVVGPEIKGGIDELNVQVSIDGAQAGSGSAANIPGGPLAAVAFAIGQMENLGCPLRAGQIISTGAITGIHKVRPNQSVRITFGPEHVMEIVIR